MRNRKNEPCFCGSGIKFKRCHGDITRFPQANISSLTINSEKNLLIGLTKDVLINQIERDGPKIARSFDKLTEFDVSEMSAVIAQSMALTIPHYTSGDLSSQDLESTSSRLVGFSISTFIASLEVARHGFRRQYGAMARTIVECLSTVLHLNMEPDALNQFYEGKLKSTDSISIAKRVLPPIGHLYGLLSNHFVHIGVAHASFEPLIPYTADDQALSFILSSMRGDAWLIYVVAELTLLHYVSEPRYWKRADGIPNGLSYNPDNAERAWQKTFLQDPEEIQLRLQTVANTKARKRSR